MAELGLRERKKQETRQRITDAAIELFAERGFEQVPVADIAAAADVSTATVFNYFPAKEDLIYDGMAAFHEHLLAAVRDRPAGQRVISAFRDYVVQPRGVLADPASPVLAGLSRIARIVQDSPSLQARERLEADRATAALHDLLVAELGDDLRDDLRAWTVASALVGTTRGMTREVQRAAAEGRVDARLAKRLLAAAAGAIDVVEAGLAGT
ncbi:TetR/AcrR family transcriptional regulator [Nocardioides nitrophenolicus]|uniref:TetR/AcrR family transcriptional regulator n=1 Tax=Nocardioides nitrophenolicus TaxID=60489 RepID=UPI00195EB3DF|nr:TetR family transcriptional regulator [Nocardioides nitrophenolicus]MBM7515642.1 AcrR family transcriptional regulator [Nocardioides nitrophenolicus]